MKDEDNTTRAENMLFNEAEIKKIIIQMLHEDKFFDNLPNEDWGSDL